MSVRRKLRAAEAVQRHADVTDWDAVRALAIQTQESGVPLENVAFRILVIISVWVPVNNIADVIMQEHKPVPVIQQQVNGASGANVA